MSYTTAQLIEILDRELQANCRGERVLLSPAKRLNNPVVAKALDPNRLSKVFAYQDFRAQIHEYQRQQKVSGIIQRHCTFNDRTLHFPELHNQLIPVAGDKEILIEAKASVLAFWQQVTPTMQLWWSNDGYQRILPDLLDRMIRQAEWAEVVAAQAELYLRLCWGNPKECNCQWAKPSSGCELVVAAIAEPSSIKI